jgi:predicted negative regulator of RcsB-dependent stress response
MRLKFSKKNILCFLASVWIVFSLVYILWDLWSDFNNVQLSNAYQQGAAAAIDKIIEETEKCQIVPVFNNEKEIRLISVSCLEEKPAE